MIISSFFITLITPSFHPLTSATGNAITLSQISSTNPLLPLYLSHRIETPPPYLPLWFTPTKFVPMMAPSPHGRSVENGGGGRKITLDFENSSVIYLVSMPC